ncbi:MAG: preprotein translocase subunit SecE [Clostridia bacterium]|nr:preprotein translocase subunit SecE [Clostridia bacterium]
MIVLAIILLVLGVLMSTGAMTSAQDLGLMLSQLFTDPAKAFSRFFASQWITSHKVLFLVSVAVLIAGGVVLVLALIKKKQNGGLGAFDKKAAKYVRDLNGERKNVIWPTMKTVLKNTGVVLVICVLVAIVVCAIDIGLGALINLMV